MVFFVFAGAYLFIIVTNLWSGLPAFYGLPFPYKGTKKVNLSQEDKPDVSRRVKYDPVAEKLAEMGQRLSETSPANFTQVQKTQKFPGSALKIAQKRSKNNE
jgi:hypothetical protein